MRRRRRYAESELEHAVRAAAIELARDVRAYYGADLEAELEAYYDEVGRELEAELSRESARDTSAQASSRRQ